MSVPTPSKVKIESINLNQLSFEYFPKRYSSGKQIGFQVELKRDIQKTENLRYKSICQVEID